MKTILLFIGLVAPFVTHAQPGFNNVYDVGLPNNYLSDLIVHNDTIVGYGIAQLDSTWQQVILLTQFDSSGNLLNWNTIADTTGDHYNIDKHWGKITHTSDGGYALTVAPLVRNSARLIKLGANLEVEFVKEYYDTNLASNFKYELLEISDGYLLFGRVQDAELVLRPFIKRVDKEGNEVWNRYFGNPNFWGDMGDIAVIADSLIVGVGEHFVSSNLFGQNRSRIHLLDMDGFSIGDYETEPYPDIGLLTKVKVTDDNKLLVYGISRVGTISGNDQYQGTFSKVDLDFNIEWTKKYGYAGTFSAQIIFRDIEPTLDGHFIAAGESYISGPNSNQSPGWLMKFSQNGDSIWSRYDLPMNSGDFAYDNYFGGVGVLSSGNIIAGGTASDNMRHIWLMKLTTDGCMEVIDCGLVPTFSTPMPDEKLVLRLSPNPANEQVQVSWQVNQNVIIRLYDLQGHTVAQQKIQQGTQQAVFETRQLPAGIYFVEMRNGDGRLDREKLLVLHR